MLTRSQVDPFVRLPRNDGDSSTIPQVHVEYFADTNGRVVPFLDRMLRLVRRLHGCTLETVEEALRRQERRVRDASRLAGLSRTIIEWCEFAAPPGVEQLEQARPAIFAERGVMWPPVPGDALRPYEATAATIGTTAVQLQRMLYDDRAGARRLRAVPDATGRELLARYNLELARGVLRDATRVVIRARGGWRDIFRAIKLAGLMHELERHGRGYRLVITGPATQYLVRPARYGVRFARVLPVLARSPGWRLDAELVRNGEVCTFRVGGRARALTGAAPVGGEPKRERLDSAWERRFVRDVRASHWVKQDGWTITRERTPMSSGGAVFLPDFTLRNADGGEVAVELVGFWTPEYLHNKAVKVRAASGVPLVLVVAKELAVGGAADALVDAAGERIVWCGRHPRVAEVMRMVERVAG